MIGQRISHYQITAKLGQGGMGEVYRARDSRLDRDVAIKVLLEHRLESPEARARFQREAKAVAALSHPNILEIYDVGEHDGVAYAVTELLEGESLRERLESGPIPLRKTIEYAGQMSDGLAAAHEAGIVHRDLKPGNVFLTSDDRLKILDFGLAKAEVDRATEEHADTVQNSTAPGTVLGTARYMSPEQVRAEPVDSRSDIFSFGTVLWEMLTGKIAFDGGSAVETMHAVLHEDPPSGSSVNPIVPTALDRIIERCMEKSPAQRFQSARDLGFALRNSSDSSALSGASPVVGSGRSKPLTLAMARTAALLLVGGLIGVFIGMRLGGSEVVPPIKVYPLTQSGADSSPSASPDGNTIAFASSRDGKERIWLRQMKGGHEAPLTEGVDTNPQFSPDGSSVLFLRGERGRSSAHRVSIVGGNPRKLISDVFEACWSPDGNSIGFVRSTGEIGSPESLVGILDLSSGQIRELARISKQFVYGLDWSPDGEWFVLSSTGVVMNAVDMGVLLIHTQTGEIREAFDAKQRVSSPSWSPRGDQIIVAKSTSLLGDISGAMGQVLRVDPSSGDATPLFWVQSVWGGSVDFVDFDFVSDDKMVFDEILWKSSLEELPLDGDLPLPGGRVLTQGFSRDRQPAYSPDGKNILFSSNRSGNLDIWILNRESGELRQITDDDAEDWDPAFSADGRSILWSSNRSGHLEIWIADADGSAARQLSNDGEDAENPTQTGDGEWVVYASGSSEHPGIWKIRSDGSDAERISVGQFLLPDVSPDGRYVAHLVNDLDNSRTRLRVIDIENAEEVFVTHVPFLGFQLVTQVGRVRWMPDGKSLMFIATNENGRSSLFRQDFVPGEDTLTSRSLVIDFADRQDVESHGISRDGRFLTISRLSHQRTLKIAEGQFLPR